MTNFETAIKIVFDHEGGYGNDPDDPGGPTNFGLIFEDMRQVGLPATVEQIQSLTPETAASIYKKLYWDAMNMDLIKDASVAICIFDQGVLQGAQTSLRMVQEIVGVDQDGELGPVTAAAINAQDPKKLAISFTRLCMHRFARIVENNPSQAKFIAGWTDRIFSLLNYGFFGDEN